MTGRWRALFDDLEAQADAIAARELQAEVSDRIRREAALLGIADRLRAGVGQHLTATVEGAGPVTGLALEVGPDWLLLADPAEREVLIPFRALLGVVGVGPGAAAPGSEGEVGRRLDLRWALRGLARDRAVLTVLLRDGALLTGTLDRVGADHVDLAEHPIGDVRRPAAVRSVRLIPLAALAMLRGS